jgi:hypothetical protein
MVVTYHVIVVFDRKQAGQLKAGKAREAHCADGFLPT